MKLIAHYLKGYRKEVSIAIISVVLLVFATLWQPRLLQVIMEAIMRQDKSTVLSQGIVLIVLAVVGIIAGVVNTVYSAKVALGVATDLRADLYRQVQTFAYADIEKFSASNLVVRMTNDINQIQMIVMSVFQQVTRIPLLFLGAVVLALITMPEQWWVVVLMMVVIIAISINAFVRMGRYFGETQEDIEAVNTVARENLMGIRVVKSFVQEPKQIEKFSEASDHLTDITTKIGQLFAVLMPSFFIIGNLAIGISVFIVGQNVTAHPTYIAAVSSFISYLTQILFAVINGGMLMTFASRAMVSLRRMQEVFDTKPSLTYVAGPAETVTGELSFDDVSFTYPGDEQATLKHISFSAPAGSMVGIVGATGSGKTTLAQLIARLYDPDTGIVKIGGQDVRSLTEPTLRQAVAFVLQRATLFSGTISGNLRQVKQDANVSNMRWAANIAQASEFIERLPNTYDASVEERSANFSGGQKQRLAITRGVIANPEILILDDATSALDARSEKLVQEALAKDLANTTTVVIAEKIASVIKADQILVLDEGELVGVGTHQELVATNSVYQEIYYTQKAKEEGANA